MRIRLAGAAEGRRILGVSAQRFQQLAAKPGFPEPVDTIEMGRIYAYDDLVAYGETRPKRAGRPAAPAADDA